MPTDNNLKDCLLLQCTPRIVQLYSAPCIWYGFTVYSAYGTPLQCTLRIVRLYSAPCVWYAFTVYFYVLYCFYSVFYVLCVSTKAISEF